MKNIINNTWLIFKRNKDFIYTTTIQPVLLFLLMSVLLAYSTTHKIAVINSDTGVIGERIYEALAELDGIDIIDVKENEAAGKILSGNIEAAVIIGENNTTLLSETGESNIWLVSLGDSEVEDTIRLVINRIVSGEVAGAETKVSFESNSVKEKGITISYSLGVMIFKILTAGNLLAALVIKERNNKMKDRILLSGIKTSAYLGGMSFMYILCMMAGSVIYYLVALLFNFDFGMKNSLGFLLILFSSNILSAALFMFASTLVKKEDSLWFMGTFVLFPVGVISGVLFPFHLMPETIQSIANLLPFRWIISGIESIQQTGQISSALPNIALIIGVSAILYAISVLRTRPNI